MTLLMQNTKRAFHGDETFAQAFVAGMDKHHELNTCWPGSYETCAIGCNVDVVNRYLGIEISNNDHGGLANAIGVPEQILQFQDVIYEGLLHKDKRAFPRDFARALAGCRDVTCVWERQMLWLLQEELSPFRCNEIDMVATLYERLINSDRPADDEFFDMADAVIKVIDNDRHHNFYAINAAWYATRAVFFPYTARSAASEVAIARRSLPDDGPPNNTSYQRQRDNLLKLLRGAAEACRSTKQY